MEELTARLDELNNKGAPAEAEALLQSAFAEAERRGDERTMLSVSSELLGFYRNHRMEDAFFAALDTALPLLERVRVTGRPRGTILINAATGMAAFGQTAQALRLFREAERCYAAALSRNDYLFAALYNNMATAHRAAGELAAAEEYTVRAVNILRTMPHHPDLAVTYVNLAQLRADRGDRARAEELLNLAMAVFDDAEVVWDGYLAHTLQKCAPAFAALDRAEDAAELTERAELIVEGT